MKRLCALIVYSARVDLKGARIVIGYTCVLLLVCAVIVYVRSTRPLGYAGVKVVANYH